MPEGLVRTDLNKTGTTFNEGSPVTIPHEFGNVVSWTPTPTHFGNPLMTPVDFGNDVSWAPSPAHFGNVFGGLAEPTFSPDASAGPFFQGVAITISAPGADAIFYTTDGSDPITNGILYTGPVTIDFDNNPLSAVAQKGANFSSTTEELYVFKAPRVDSISPSSGPIAGGTMVTITGDGFHIGDITLKGVFCVSPAIVDYQHVTGVSGSTLTSGVGDVVVINSDQQTGTLHNGWTYTP